MIDESALVEVYKYADQLRDCSVAIIEESQKKKPDVSALWHKAHEMKHRIDYLITQLELLDRQT
jgi:hypothetical protein